VTDGWSVDPDRVMGVLAGVDDAGASLEGAGKAMDELSFSASSLSVDGRTMVSNAWASFVGERRLVPGKLMHVLASSARSVTEATVAVVAGDAEMETNAATAEERARVEWGIESDVAYGGGML